ncbi:MAG: DNA internalization-related competence protein ComEC/Rec2 [Lachnospiraceae bacterium]|nr:DNA internalization-related competence protein ComEC/Rec2 [Lachnospiraceae bacterium]
MILRRPLCMACLAVILFFAVGLWLYPPEYFSYGEASGGQVVITGRVCAKEFKKGEDAPVLLIYLKPDSLFFENHPISFEKQILCTMEADTYEPAIGARIKVEGILIENEPALNPGGFDARLYYTTLGISARLFSGKLTAVSSEQNLLRELLWQCRRGLGNSLDAVLSEEDAAFMKTMLLGDKSAFAPQQKQLYKEAGILHILSISGLHISFLGMGIYRLLKKSALPRWISAVLCGILILLYGEMVGMPLSAIRAVFMFLMRLLADVVGRTYDGLTALSLCAALLLLEQPLYLLHAGFLFSFSAVLAILWLKPALHMPELRFPGLGEGLAASLSIAIFTLPIQLLFYYEFSVYAPLFNLLVLPLTGTVLVLGITAMVTGCFSTWSARPFAFLLEGILHFYEQGSLLVGKLPHHLLTPGQPKWWQIGIFYTLVLLIIRFPALRFRYQTGLLGGAVFLLCIHFHIGLTVTVLDVGQGECICLELPMGETYLIDGGSSSVSEVADYRIEPFLKSRGITGLDAVFLSHGDSDHTNGVMRLLKEGNIRIRTLVLPAAADKDEQGFSEILRMAEEREIPVLFMSAGMNWQSGDVALTCLHPTVDFVGENDNAGSQVLYLSYGNFSMLFTGDTEGNGEQALLKTLKDYGITDLSILKVAHHGSGGCTGEELLLQLSPDIAVISYGKNNLYGHPHPELLKRLSESGCRIFGTGGTGAVSFYTDGQVLKLN